MLNPDYSDMLSALSAERVEYLVVVALAMAAHGHPRATGGLGIWVKPSRENARRVWRALAVFGAPLGDVTEEDFSREGIAFQIGVAPRRIDILTTIDGVTFAEAWPSKVEVEVEGHRLPVLGRAELLRNKRASGRPQDLADAERLLGQP